MVDMFLFIAIYALAIILGLLCIKIFPLITIVCAVFIMVFSAFMFAYPTISVSYALNSTDQWQTKEVDVPYNPYLQMFLFLVGICFMILAWALSE
jgi:hypothetical protein